ncbi:hypothetical protein [Luteolibacter soli]|uniref:Uncharacterized protein n=1 Tax=Luteolibacter soli TaxID=3135280 RepID=A0ABU9AUW7_9BACT
MIPRSSLSLTIATHTLAVAGGWLLLSQFNKPPAPPPPTASSKASQRSIAPERSVDEILGELTSPDKKKLTPEAKKLQDFRDSVKAAIRDMTPPADFAAAVEEELAARKGLPPDAPRSTKLIALMYHWMVADPAALFKWAAQDPARVLAIPEHATVAIQEVLQDHGATALLPAIGFGGPLNNYIMNLTATQIAMTGDLAAFKSMKEKVNPQLWQNIRQLTVGQWPVEKKDDLLKMAIEENSPAMLTPLARRDPETAAWLTGLASDTSLPEDFRKAFLADRGIRQLLYENPQTSLEDRLTYIDTPDQKIATDRLLRGDVMRLMSAPQDLGFAFRRGEITAEEVYQSIAAGTPELASASPETLRSLVFQNLAEEDPAKAMALLKDLPESEQHQTMLTAARTFFNDVEPDHFLAALQQVPSDTPELWEQRLDAWNLRSFTNSNRLNEDFLAWVRNLPPGLDREMGLYSLARAVQLTDLKLAAQLRSEVTDPQLQKRIADHR